MSITHATVAVGTDAGTGEIHKAEWNAAHVGSGLTQSYIGYNTIGGTAENLVANRVLATSVTLASAGLLGSVEFYVDTTGDFVSGSWITAVWDDNASAIGKLIHISGSFVVDNELLSGTGSSFPARWLSRPCGVWLAAGTYWIGGMTNDIGANLRIYRDGSGSDRRFDSGGAWIADGQRYSQTNTTFKYSIRGNLIA